MATYPGTPIESLNSFNSLNYTLPSQGLREAEADLLYLKYPVAQGTENLQATNINGALQVNSTASFTNTISGTIQKSNNITDGNSGDLLYQSASNTTSKLPIGTNNFVLTSNGSIPVWSSLPAPPATPTLSNVLVAGNSAGSNGINMNSQTITNASSISATTFNGALNGNANTATTATNATNAVIGLTNLGSNQVVPLINTTTATAGNYPLSMATTYSKNILFNNVSGMLTCNGITSTLTGNASSATTATTATNVNLSATATGNPYYLVMSATQSSSSALLTDNSGASYDSGTNTITANISGNSATATTATNALACSGNSATATTATTATNALACSGNSATATTATTATNALACSGNSATATTATTATNVAGGANGSLVYQTGPSATTTLPIGTNNQVLVSNGTIPVWTTPAVVSTPNLSAVLTAGNSAGSTDINMNGNDITGSYLINNVFYELKDFTTLATDGSIYASSGVFNYDNNINSGSHNFAVNDAGGVQRIPLNLTSSQISCGAPINLNSNNITNGATITATNFTGALNGNATSATTATTATNANNVNISNTASGATNYVLLSTAISGNAPVLTDTSGLTYNSTTNTLVANITGSAGTLPTTLSLNTLTIGTTTGTSQPSYGINTNGWNSGGFISFNGTGGRIISALGGDFIASTGVRIDSWTQTVPAGTSSLFEINFTFWNSTSWGQTYYYLQLYPNRLWGQVGTSAFWNMNNAINGTSTYSYTNATYAPNGRWYWTYQQLLSGQTGAYGWFVPHTNYVDCYFAIPDNSYSFECSFKCLDASSMVSNNRSWQVYTFSA